MTNVRISEKGKAFLKKQASAKVARAIVRGGSRLSDTGNLSVNVNGTSINIKGARAEAQKSSLNH